MYVLDEPSIGLHQRDNARLIGTLKHLRDLGNSVLVVEHDEDMIRAADHVIDMGPGAGKHGGRVIAQGTPDDVAASAESLTGRYLSRVLRIEVPTQRHSLGATPEQRTLTVVNARGNNLKGVTAAIPVGLFTCVTGVSGSGKSTLINDTLYTAVAQVNRPTGIAAVTPFRLLPRALTTVRLRCSGVAPKLWRCVGTSMRSTRDR